MALTLDMLAAEIIISCFLVVGFIIGHIVIPPDGLLVAVSAGYESLLGALPMAFVAKFVQAL